MKPQITNSAASAYTGHVDWILSLVGLVLLICLTPTIYAQSEAIPITACQDISAPGSFVLARDLVETQAESGEAAARQALSRSVRPGLARGSRAAVRARVGS